MYARTYLSLTTLILAALWLPGAVAQSEQPSAKPNVVFILIDDLGWTDLGCYGSRVYRTPAIDRLAAQGIRFTQAYSAHPMCSPSRYAILSGRHPSRWRGPDVGWAHLAPEEISIAETLKKHGYATFFAGKWHVSYDGKYPNPEGQGFDVNKGGHKMGAPASYFYPYGKVGEIRRVPGLQEDGKPGEYLTDRLTDETIAFIREHRDEPFFAYLSHYAVHTPLQARKGLVAQYKERIDATSFQGPAYIRMRGTDQKMRQDNATFAAMVHAVDQGVGRIMKELQDLGLTENTIVLFTSDNGGDSSKAKRGGMSTSNVPLKGGKCWIYEGGVRVPFIARWPRVIAAGRVSDRLVAGMDHYPSILELLGLPLRPEQHLDGVSYAPVLRGQPRSPRKPIVHNFPEGIARIGIDAGTSIRHEDFKLIVFKNGTRELYNLQEDVGEEHDLSRAMPEKVDELESLLDIWRAEMQAHQLK